MIQVTLLISDVTTVMPSLHGFYKKKLKVSDIFLIHLQQMSKHSDLHPSF